MLSYTASGWEFTLLMRQAIADANPDWDVAITGDLTLTKDGGPIINLARIFGVCVQAPDRFEKSALEFVSQLSRLATEAPVISRDNLLVGIRRTSDIAEDNQGARVQTIVPAVPFLDEMSRICLFKQPTAMIRAEMQHLTELGLSLSEAIKIGTRQVGAELGLINEADVPESGSYLTLPSHPLESSRLLSFEGWQAAIAKLGTGLIVAVPSAEIVMIGCGSTDFEIRQFKAVVARQFEEAQRPLSATAYRWAPHGWVAIGQ